jgi:flagellar hook-basal body complex protein FliE
MVVDESKLQEMIAREVARALKSSFQDMDEIRRSPAGAIIRVETELENLREKVEIIEEKVDRLSVQAEAHRAETKKDADRLAMQAEAHRAEAKKDNEALREEITKVSETLGAEITKVNDTLQAKIEKSNDILRGDMRTDNQNLRNEMVTKSHLTMLYGLLIALLGFVGTMIVKMFFFTP